MERPGGSEIVELTNGEAESCSFSKLGNKYSIEDDINRLFEAIDIKSSSKGVEPVHGGSKERLMKKAMKRPMRVGSPQSIGIGISENVNLKQALRGLCISQASEMAATKRLSRLAGSSGTSESGNTKRLNKVVVVETSGSGLHFTQGNGNLVEISLVPEISRSERAKPSDQSTHCPLDIRLHLPTPCEGETSGAKDSEPGALSSLFVDHDGIKDTNAMSLAQKKLPDNTPIAEEQKNHLNASSSLSSFKTQSLVKTFTSSSPSFLKPIFRNKSSPTKKVKQSSASPSSSCISLEDKVGNSPNPSILGRTTNSPSLESVKEDCDDASPASTNVDHNTDVNSSTPDAYSSTMVSCSIGSSRQRFMLAKIVQTPRIKEKGDVSQSSKSSIGEYSSGTSISEDSSLSWSSHSGNRPHMSRDLRWEAIRQIQKQHGSLCLKHFKLVKKLGCGDIGSVYLAELTGTNCLFALKVMDTELLASRKKLLRAQTEKEILQMLDHPFLPTLYANLISEKLCCLVMEYCPGGDLHVLRQRQAGRSFSEQAVRFYAAEVLLSIEYLHMLGVVYRDLKPENVLVREDGHIMLSDFDLSLRCRVDPIVVQSSSPAVGPTKKTYSPCLESSCIEPFCLHPSWQVSCFTPRLLSVASKSRKLKSDLAAQISPLPQLVVEPTSARSNSFVGTYEYLAPEIVKSEGHGSAVDWWTFGIFLFELLYGKTPFKGSGNDETLANVVSRSLRFPSSPMVSYHARDLIRWLLVKEPENRLGSGKGAADIKQHSFFEGLNWALVRCAVPPELPQPCDALIGASAMNNDDGSKGKEPKSTEDSAYFDMF